MRNTHAALPETGDFVRLPGLFRRWEIERVIEVGVDYHIEQAGAAEDGTPLYAVYRHQSEEDDA